MSVPTYVNPKGSPAVPFAGPVRYTREVIAAACRRWGGSLWLSDGPGIDGARLLWALAGNESGFGFNCMPRHEWGYCPTVVAGKPGRYSTSPDVIGLTRKFGHAAHCSFGPWQTMLVNAGTHADPAMFDSASSCAMVAVGFVNAEILKRQGAVTIDQIAEAYNSGNFRRYKGKVVPTDYIQGVLNHYYDVPMPEASDGEGSDAVAAGSGSDELEVAAGS